jgi:hypothetical protein
MESAMAGENRAAPSIPPRNPAKGEMAGETYGMVLPIQKGGSLSRKFMAENPSESPSAGKMGYSR